MKKSFFGYNTDEVDELLELNEEEKTRLTKRIKALTRELEAEKEKNTKLSTELSDLSHKDELGEALALVERLKKELSAVRQELFVKTQEVELLCPDAGNGTSTAPADEKEEVADEGAGAQSSDKIEIGVSYDVNIGDILS